MQKALEMSHRYHFDKVVIGGSIHALLYCRQNNIPLVINDLTKPFRFEKIKLEQWNKLYFLLSLSGLNLFGEEINNINLRDDELVIVKKNLKTIKLQFNKLIMFDDKNVEGLPEPLKKRDELVVLDWMNTENCMMHNHDDISTDDKFVERIYFYPTDRIFGNHATKKDLIVISQLTEKQLNDFDYSDTMARLKTEKILKDAGITGRKNGFAGGKQINYLLKLKVKKREVRKLEMDLYKDTEKIEFNYSKADDSTETGSKYINKLESIFND